MDEYFGSLYTCQQHGDLLCMKGPSRLNSFFPDVIVWWLWLNLILCSEVAFHGTQGIMETEAMVV